MIFGWRAGWANDTGPLPPFAWPLEGKLVDDEDGHPSPASREGIGILVPEGTQVRAALAGQVIYAGDGVNAFGNLVLLRHENGWVTVYGHNGELFVNRGDVIETGRVIARSGKSVFVLRPQLRFEIRKNEKPLNPALYLSRLRAQDEIP